MHWNCLLTHKKLKQTKVLQSSDWNETLATDTECFLLSLLKGSTGASQVTIVSMLFSDEGRLVFSSRMYTISYKVWAYFSSAFCLPPSPFRKPIIPQKEPSPLLEKKIQQLEAKFAELEGGDEDMEEMGEEEGDMTETPSMPQLQTPLASELDIMPYTPPQVRIALRNL